MNANFYGCPTGEGVHYSLPQTPPFSIDFHHSIFLHLYYHLYSVGILICSSCFIQTPELYDLFWPYQTSGSQRGLKQILCIVEGTTRRELWSSVKSQSYKMWIIILIINNNWKDRRQGSQPPLHHTPKPRRVFAPWWWHLSLTLTVIIKLCQLANAKCLPNELKWAGRNNT